MHTRISGWAHGWLALSLMMSAGGADAAQTNFVAPPDQKVAGQTQAEWSARWWQWASSFDAARSPVADRTGKLCANGQQGDVWFLAGVYGSSPVKRECAVPAGKWLFFPIVNYVTYPPAPDAVGCESLIEDVRAYTERPRDLTLIIDGVAVEDLTVHRQATRDCFDLGARSGERIYPAAGNGYYVMLKPLPPGRHTIKWGGILETLRQAVVYEITVAGDVADTL